LAKIQLQPSGVVLEVPEGTALRDCLFEHGLEFPCGGTGSCRGCLIRVNEGNLPITESDISNLDDEEIADGWRLACQASVHGDLTLELPSIDMDILSDVHTVTNITSDTGLGIAIDIGTTTLAAQLVERSSLNVLGTVTALNPQGRFGADLMSRLDYALKSEKNSNTMADLIQDELYELITKVLPKSGGGELERITLVGNTVMHHLFAGLPVQSLAQFPFNPASLDSADFMARDLGWNNIGNPTVSMLPNLGGFVGSDILAGILATGMHESSEQVALLDLGTNGEMVVGNRDGLICASAAAGPAFEGAGIGMGMSAVTGAVSEVFLDRKEVRVHVLGGGNPRGICGSGLVDAIALGLDLGIIQHDGRLQAGDDWVLAAPLKLTQRDIREVQLAKGAIGAGLRLLLQEAKLEISDLKAVYLAGAFGNFIHADKAQRVGLLECSSDQIFPVGNGALRGAKLALRAKSDSEIQSIRAMTNHIELATLPGFQDSFADAMFFKDSRGSFNS